jgi:ABC-2 type transport system permease protein
MPLLWLTVREFGAGRAIRVVGLFAATPIVFALIYLINSGEVTPVRFISATFLNFLAPTVVPLATLVLATGALGNELSDRTIAYIALKPIGRWRIVVEKFAGVVVVTALAFLVGATITWALIELGSDGSGTHTLLALLAAILAGVVAYGAAFLLISLVVPRSLIVGIIYILLWESLLARFIPGIKLLSVRHFTQSIYIRILDDPAFTLDRAVQLSSALSVLAVIVVASLLLATLRLRSMNLD